MSTTIETMRLLGGRPSLDLVNTVDSRRDRWGPDLLAGYHDLVTWSGRVGVLDPAEGEAAAAAAQAAPDEAAAALHRARALREALAALLSPTEGHDLAAAAGIVAGAVDEARRCQWFRPADGGRFDWVWDGEAALDRILHRVAIDAAALLTDPALRARVRACPGPTCGWLFLDTTKNRSRRWCRDEGCGAHARVLRYRARR